MIGRVRLQRIEGSPVTLHFSPGYRRRAETLGALIQEAHTFLGAWLGVDGSTTLAVLRFSNWSRLRRAPYGYPHSSPERATIYAPARYPPRFLNRAQALYDAVPVEQQRAFGEGEEVPSRIAEFYDLVAVHELGHLFIHHLALLPGTRWLTELIANLFATAFFVERRPDLANCWLAWAAIQAAQPVEWRPLAEIEAGYTQLDFRSASHLQGRLTLEAARLWQQQGAAVATEIVQQFSGAHDPVRRRFQIVAPDFRWEPPTSS